MKFCLLYLHQFFLNMLRKVNISQVFSIQFQKFRKNIILPKKRKKQMKKKSKNPRKNSDFIKRFKIMSLWPVLAKPLTWVFFTYLKLNVELNYRS